MSDKDMYKAKIRYGIATSIYLGDPVGFNGYTDATNKIIKFVTANELEFIEDLEKLKDIEDIKALLFKRSEFLKSI